MMTCSTGRRRDPRAGEIEACREKVAAREGAGPRGVRRSALDEGIPQVEKCSLQLLLAFFLSLALLDSRSLQGMALMQLLSACLSLSSIYEKVIN